MESSLLGFVATENDGLSIIDYQDVEQPIKASQLPIDDSLTTIEFLTHIPQVMEARKAFTWSTSQNRMTHY